MCFCQFYTSKSNHHQSTLLMIQLLVTGIRKVDESLWIGWKLLGFVVVWFSHFCWWKGGGNSQAVTNKELGLKQSHLSITQPNAESIKPHGNGRSLGKHSGLWTIEKVSAIRKAIRWDEKFKGNQVPVAANAEDFMGLICVRSSA